MCIRDVGGCIETAVIELRMPWRRSRRQTACNPMLHDRLLARRLPKSCAASVGMRYVPGRGRRERGNAAGRAGCDQQRNPVGADRKRNPAKNRCWWDEGGTANAAVLGPFTDEQLHVRGGLEIWEWRAKLVITVQRAGTHSRIAQFAPGHFEREVVEASRGINVEGNE